MRIMFWLIAQKMGPYTHHNSKGSGESSHLCSLIRVCAVCTQGPYKEQTIQYPKNGLACTFEWYHVFYIKLPFSVTLLCFFCMFGHITSFTKTQLNQPIDTAWSVCAVFTLARSAMHQQHSSGWSVSSQDSYAQWYHFLKYTYLICSHITWSEMEPSHLLFETIYVFEVQKMYHCSMRPTGKWVRQEEIGYFNI